MGVKIRAKARERKEWLKLALTKIENIAKINSATSNGIRWMSEKTINLFLGLLDTAFACYQSPHSQRLEVTYLIHKDTERS